MPKKIFTAPSRKKVPVPETLLQGVSSPVTREAWYKEAGKMEEELDALQRNQEEALKEYLKHLERAGQMDRLSLKQVLFFLEQGFLEIEGIAELNLSVSKNVELLHRSLQEDFDFTFRGLNLQGADLSTLKLRGKNEVDLQEADLTGAYLKGADLTRVGLYKARLENAELRNVNLWGADLEGASLVGADLEGASLIRANLTGADVEGANLRGVNFFSALLEGVDLRKAELEGANLEGATYDPSQLEDTVGTPIT